MKIGEILRKIADAIDDNGIENPGSEPDGRIQNPAELILARDEIVPVGSPHVEPDPVPTITPAVEPANQLVALEPVDNKPDPLDDIIALSGGEKVDRDFAQLAVEKPGEVVEIDPAANSIIDSPEIDLGDKPADALSDIIALAGGEKVNTTIAQPAPKIIPKHPVFVPPLQQQIELNKQQGGKESPIINQIIHHHGEAVASTAADKQPKQSIYHGLEQYNNEPPGA